MDRIKMDNEENKSMTDLEWQQRILCPDESCIGVIGPDGRCKECGLPYTGSFDPTKIETVAPDFEATDPEDEIDEDSEDEINEEPEEFEEHDTEAPSDLEWEQRKLCSDESCIGVIGPDGRCKECGKPYDGE
jgi:hypothetical protein